MSEKMPDQWIEAPTLAEVKDAAQALAGIAVTTPVLENSAVHKELSARLLIKAERE